MSLTSQMITGARYQRDGSIVVELVDQPPDVSITVPDDMDNTDRRTVAAWEAAGNTITPFPTTKPVDPVDPFAELRAELARIGERLDALERRA